MGIAFQITTDGGWWQSRHVLTAQGKNEQTEMFVLLIPQLLVGRRSYRRCVSGV
jgi:hypothetical protein